MGDLEDRVLVLERLFAGYTCLLSPTVNEVGADEYHSEGIDPDASATDKLAWESIAPATSTMTEAQQAIFEHLLVPTAREALGFELERDSARDECDLLEEFLIDMDLSEKFFQWCVGRGSVYEIYTAIAQRGRSKL